MTVDTTLPHSGVLKKWTNYVNGWQDRYFEIKNGSLLYFKSKVDKSYGCRGSLALKSVNITGHEFDECEFTVSVGSDLVWYLKAENCRSKQLWMRALTKETNDSDYSSTSTKSHSRNASSVSSVYIGEQFEDNDKLFASRISELEAYRTMCCDQMTSIQRQLEVQPNVQAPALLSLKATHLALLNNINHIIELLKSGKASLSDVSISTPEPSAREVVATAPCDPVSPSTATYITCIDRSDTGSEVTMTAPASNVDATSEMGDEWHDADEHSSMSSVEQATEARGSLSPSPEADHREDDVCRATIHATPRTSTPPVTHAIPQPLPRNLPFGQYDLLDIPSSHTMHQQVESLATEQLRYALAGVEDNVWTLFAEDGAMRMYTREINDDGGLPVDPLKAVHQVKGVSALEFMHYFYDAQFKKDWDHTLNDMSIVEKISRDTVVLHQKHKTVWPAAPRESLFVSHIRRVDNMKQDHAHDLYIVCNKDIKRADVPLGSSSSVRVGLTVSMICETVLLNKKPLNELTRDDVLCNIIYVSQVHPGGWVPTAALRHVYKKEYPKFLRTFTDFVLKQVKGKPLAI